MPSINSVLVLWVYLNNFRLPKYYPNTATMAWLWGQNEWCLDWKPNTGRCVSIEMSHLCER